MPTALELVLEDLGLEGAGAAAGCAGPDLVRWTRGILPIGEEELPFGTVVELRATLPAEALPATAKVRLDIVKPGRIFGTNPVTSLVGTDASAPDEDWSTAPRETRRHSLGADESFDSFVADFQRQHPGDHERYILVVDDPFSALPKTELLAWWTLRPTESRVLFAVVVDGEQVGPCSERLSAAAPAAAGVWVRLHGRVLDASPATPWIEPVPDAEVRLGTAATRSGLDGRWVVRARLPLGDTRLELARSGIDPVALTARVSAEEEGAVRVALRDVAGAVVAEAVTSGAPDPVTAVELAVPDLRVLVHKVRGTVVWPDSRSPRPGSPLEGRRVYALPCSFRPPAEVLPQSTRAWDELKRSPRALASRRIGFDRPLALTPPQAQSAIAARHGDFGALAAPTSAPGRVVISVENQTAAPLQLGGGTTQYRVTGTAGGRSISELIDVSVAANAREMKAGERRHFAGVKSFDAVTSVCQVARQGEAHAAELRLAAWFACQRTDADGRFELPFLDLASGDRYLVWVESHDPRDTAHPGSDSPEYVVKTVERELIEMDALAGDPDHGRADVVRRTSLQLVDHGTSLTLPGREAIGAGLELVRSALWHPEEVTLEPVTQRALVWPSREALGEFDAEPMGADLRVHSALIYDGVADGLTLQVLPLVPLFESPDAQSASARRVRAALLEACDAAFPRGHFAFGLPGVDGHGSREIRFALDARRLTPGVDLVNGTWQAAAAPARRVEQLEQTFVASPELGPRARLGVGDARWRCDAITLADYAFVSTPSGTIAARTLDADVAPVLAPVLPRLTGLAASRHLYLGPGHGLYATYDAPGAPGSPDRWSSPRGGWGRGAGEDDVDVYLASHLERIAAANGLRVTTCRELRSFSVPGVTHGAVDSFVPTRDADFPRLWQQNPVYYVAEQVDRFAPSTARIVLGHATWGRPIANKNNHGIDVRLAHLEQVAPGIDLVLFVHTNAGGAAQRGVWGMYLDIVGAAGEENVLGQRYADACQRAVRARCNVGALTVTVTQNQRVIGDLRRTFDYWTQAMPPPPTVPPSGPPGDSIWPRRVDPPADPSGWSHRVYPRRFPVALVEVGFHSNEHDAALNSRAWHRRLAAEALAIATEQTLFHAWPAALGPNPRPDRRNDLSALLEATFGRTAALVALPGGADDLTGAHVRDDVNAVTGEALALPAVPGAPLGAAVARVEEARDGFTAGDFLRARTGSPDRGLREVLAELVGYDDTDPEIEARVVRNLLGGLEAQVRPDKPLTRRELAELVANAAGITPARLDVVIGTPVGAAPLMDALDGTPAPDAFVTRRDAAELLTRLRALEPDHLFHVADAYLADRRLRRLATADAPDRYRLSAHVPIAIVAETRGIPCKGTPAEVSFTIQDATGRKQRLEAAFRGSSRVVSAMQPLLLAGRARSETITCTIEVRAKHPRRGWFAIGTKQVTVEVVACGRA